MNSLEILEAHTFGHSLLTVRGFCDGCDWHSYTGPKVAIEAHRAHLAEVLDKHMQEREAEAVRDSARYIERLMPPGLVHREAVLADLTVAELRIGRGLHANGRDKEPRDGRE